MTVISSVACQKEISLLLVKVPALHLLPLFRFLFNYVVCTQEFSASQQKLQLDPSDGTPRRDFWSLMIISLPPPCIFLSRKRGGMTEAAPRTGAIYFFAMSGPATVGQRALAATLFAAFPSLKLMTKMAGKPEALLLPIPNKP